MNVRITRAAKILGLNLCLLISTGCQDQASSASSLLAASAATFPQGMAAGARDASRIFAALDAARQSQRFLFVFLWKSNDHQTQSMRDVFGAFAQDVADQADALDVTVSAVSEQGFVKQYGLSRAPMPVVLAFAPNGAITGGFPTEFAADDLQGALVSPATADVMKWLQDGKLVLLCLQNNATEFNEEARRGAEEFCRDARYQNAARLVVLDPASPGEQNFIKDLDVAPTTAAAITVLLAPPGSPIAKFEGATTKDALVEAIAKASAGCCPGGTCGPDGCGP